jgi:hypothetical protein
MGQEATTGQAAAPKICVRCGQDCSERKRVKDAAGRYVCQECLDKALAAKAAAQRSAAKQAEAPAIEPAAAAAPPAPPAPTVPDPADDGTIPLELEESPAPQVARSPAGESRPCPLCGTAMRGEDVICTECGYSRETGKRLEGAGKAVRSKKPRTAKCQKCGYSLAGLSSTVCPECGHKNRVENRWWIDPARERRDARWEYFKPLLMLAIGGGLTLLILALAGDAEEALSYSIAFAIKLPVGLAVFLMCCYLWIGFDAPIRLTILRLAGIFAVVDLVALVVGYPLSGVPVLGTYGVLLIAGGVYVGLLMDMLELDLQDACIVGLITYVVWVVGGLFLVAYFGM